MASASFQLVMRSGPTPGKTYPLNKGEMYIGRDINNDIVISDAEISRKHSRLILQGGGYIIEDLGSTNGTFVNGQRLMGPYILHPGELLMLGENVGLSYEATPFDVNATVIGSAQGMPMGQPQNVPPPQVQSYTPPPPPPIDSFSSPYSEPKRTTAPLVEPVAPPPPTPKGGCRKWVFAGCGCLVVLICIVVVAFAVIYMAAPAQVEQAACAAPLRAITDPIFQILGYHCP